MDNDFQPGMASVVVPTHNRAHFLIDCVESVVAQTHRPLELIVIDDGSSDETEFKLRKWSSGLARDGGLEFKYIRQERAGANVARNRGLIESKGEFIQFLDSDDLLLPQKLERGIRAIKDSGADFAYCVVSFCNERLETVPGTFGIRGNGSDDDITKYLWQTMGPVYTRRVVSEVGPWIESIFYADDWEYSTRVKLMGYTGFFDGWTGARLRIHPRPERKKSEQLLQEANDTFQACEHIHSFATRLSRLSPGLRRRLAKRFLMVSLQLGRSGDFARQRQALIRAQELAPKHSLTRRLASTWPRCATTFLPTLALNVIRCIQRVQA